MDFTLYKIVILINKLELTIIYIAILSDESKVFQTT